MNKLSKIGRLFKIFSYFTSVLSKWRLLYSIVLIVFSQLLLLISYFLPIKILLIISSEEVTKKISELFFDLGKDEIIVFLTISVFFVYSFHLILEKVISLNIHKMIFEIFKTRKLSLNTFEFKYLDSLIKLLSNSFLIFLLFLIIVFIYPFIGMSLFFYFLLLSAYFINVKIAKDKFTNRLKIISGFGFMLIFLLEILDITYFKMNTETSIYSIVIVLILSRYIFMRIIFIISKVFFINSSYGNFLKKVNLIK